MALSSSKITDVTKAKTACLVTIAVSCVAILARIWKRGYV
jgi:geranylgeranyl pyrophosphate synthase